MCVCVCAHLESFRWAAYQEEIVFVCVRGSPWPQLLSNVVQLPPAERHILETAESYTSVKSWARPTHLHTHHLKKTGTQKHTVNSNSSLTAKRRGQEARRIKANLEGKSLVINLFGFPFLVCCFNTSGLWHFHNCSPRCISCPSPILFFCWCLRLCFIFHY